MSEVQKKPSSKGKPILTWDMFTHRKVILTDGRKWFIPRVFHKGQYRFLRYAFAGRSRAMEYREEVMARFERRFGEKVDHVLVIHDGAIGPN